MNEEASGSPASDRNPMEEKVKQSTEKHKAEAETQAKTQAALPDSPNTKDNPSSALLKETLPETNDEIKSTGGEPPVDWFEPLEDDGDDDDDYGDASSIGKNDPEEESLAGESERSESVAGSEKASRKMYQ